MENNEGLTVEKLRSMTGLTLTDEEAEEMVDAIRKFAKILLQVAFKEGKGVEERNSNEKLSSSEPS